MNSQRRGGSRAAGCPEPAAKPRRTALRRQRCAEGSSPSVSRRPLATVKRILVPIDFSDCSCKVLQYAVVLASALNASLVLLYVAETVPAGSEFGAKHLPELETDLRRMAKAQFPKLTKVIPSTIARQSITRAGIADSQIIEVANSLQADLIVMATHGKHSQRGQLGTTAGRVASMAGCPVLLVPITEAALPFFL